MSSSNHEPTLWEWLNSEGERAPRCIKALTPRYDELTLFLMATTFLLLLFTNATLRAEADEFLFTRFDPRLLILVLLAVAGLVLSICHVFTRRPKSSFEKFLMVLFAVCINGYGGIAAGVHILGQSKGWLIVFPIWNIICGAWLLLLFRCHAIDDSNVSDRNAALPQALIGLAALGALFTLCQYVWDCYWAITLSICVVYATSFSELIWKLATLQRKRDT